jgi:hypothetical protein
VLQGKIAFIPAPSGAAGPERDAGPEQVRPLPFLLKGPLRVDFLRDRIPKRIILMPSDVRE